MKHKIDVVITMTGLPGTGKSQVLDLIRHGLKANVPTFKQERFGEHAIRLTGTYYTVNIGKGRRCNSCQQPLNTCGPHKAYNIGDGRMQCAACGTIHED